MKNKIALTLLVSIWMPVSWAQCIGVDTGGGQCMLPPWVPGSPLNQGGENGYAPTPAPRVVWADRYGAIAADDTTGQTGTASNRPSKAEAERVALDGCAMYGSPHCKTVLSYINGCGAMASGVDGSGDATASTQEEANRKAIDNCNRYSSKGGCKIIYSKCSLPVRVQ